MKRTLFTIILALFAATAFCQSQIKYGSLSYNSLLHEMPELMLQQESGLP